MNNEVTPVIKKETPTAQLNNVFSDFFILLPQLIYIN